MSRGNYKGEILREWKIAKGIAPMLNSYRKTFYLKLFFVLIGLLAICLVCYQLFSWFNQRAYFDAIVRDDRESLENVIRRQPSVIRARDQFGDTGLNFAVEYSSYSAAQVLISHGIELDTECGRIGMPFHYACYYSDFKMAELLLRAGCNVNGQTSSSHTPLHCAVGGGNPEIAKLLLDNGADVNSVSNFWHVTPIFMATASVRREENRVASIQLLLKHGADTKFIKPDGVTIVKWIQDAPHLQAEEKQKMIDLVTHP